MSSSCLKLLLALTLLVIITECQPRRPRKQCTDDADCSPGFSCLKTPKGRKMCAKAKAKEPSKYKNTDYTEGIERTRCLLVPVFYKQKFELGKSGKIEFDL